jgi:hypothetical protein
MTDGKRRRGKGSYLQAGDRFTSVPFGAATKKREGCVETRPFRTMGSILAAAKASYNGIVVTEAWKHALNLV